MLALPRYTPVDMLRKKMRPFVKPEDLDSFDGSHFIEEHWVRWKKGVLQRPGFTPYGLYEHESWLMAHMVEYSARTRSEALSVLTTNIREFERSIGRAFQLGLPPAIAKLFASMDIGLFSLLGARLVPAGHFIHGVLFSTPELGMYRSFPEPL